ncbi:tetraspanin-5 isoform X2 [Lemur catta]|uniref:tetraspanin-5 isoform X2 n=1 Tax=Lemur catta TaxID=9447 RepID=UPI001E26CB6B|nr:tetraspanin-5 isoform X2 [Lemur catta]
MSGKHYKGPEVSCCIKYFIFGFNVIFWGVLSNISSITDLGGFDPVWLFLVVGGVMFILGFAGCIGALRENTFLLKFFSVFLGIIFFLELTAGVLAFVFKDWIKDQLYFFINNNIRAYRDDIDLQNLIDFTQEYWQCCGAFGADDWNLNIYFNCTDSNASRERCGVPFSCCTKDPAEDVINTQCGYDARQKPEVDQQIVIYTKGCVPQFEKWLQDNLTIVAGIFIGIALLQMQKLLRSAGTCWLSFISVGSVVPLATLGTDMESEVGFSGKVLGSVTEISCPFLSLGHLAKVLGKEEGTPTFLLSSHKSRTLPVTGVILS